MIGVGKITSISSSGEKILGRELFDVVSMPSGHQSGRGFEGEMGDILREGK